MNGGEYPKKVERGIRRIGPDRFEVRVFIGRDPVTGKVRSASRVVHSPSIREARRALAQLETEIESRRFAGPGITFGALLEEWLRFGERGGWATNTLSENRRKVEKVLIPVLGAIPLEQLTAHRLDTFYQELLAGLEHEGLSGAPLKPRSVLGYHRLISAALRQGRKWGKVDRNVAEDATPPKVRAEKHTIPTAGEVAELVAKADRSDRLPEFGTLLRLAAHTGARRGELCALRWGDVDFVDSKLTIRHAIGSFGGRTEIKDPKSHATREVTLGPVMLEVLIGRLDRARSVAERFDRTIGDDCFVFSLDPDGSTYLRPDTVSQAFGRLRMQLERDTRRPWPYRFHDLRHFAATEALRAGFSATDAAHRLGHADATLIHTTYGHGTEERARALAEALDGGFS